MSSPKSAVFLSELEALMEREFFLSDPALMHGQSKVLNPTEREIRRDNTLDDPPEVCPGTLVADSTSSLTGKVAENRLALDRFREAVRVGTEKVPLSEHGRQALQDVVDSSESTQTSLRFISTTLPPILQSAEFFMKNIASQQSTLADPTVDPAELLSRWEPVVSGLCSTLENHKFPQTRPANAFPNSPLSLRSLFDNAKLAHENKKHQVRDQSSFEDLEPFRYDTLPSRTSIRLFRFEDVSKGCNSIKISLHTADLNESPSFTALSYVWSDHRPKLHQSLDPARAQRSFRIACNEHSVRVTYNLLQALQQLRTNSLGNLSEYIWIDQICINQEDLSERSAQVSIMGDVYKSAQRVVAWLGVHDRYTDNALGLLGKFAEIPKEQYSDPAYDVSSLILNIPSESWEALSALLSRPYFIRAWVVQEVALAERLTFLCGTKEVSWQKMVQFSKFITTTRPWTLLSNHATRFASIEDRFQSQHYKTHVKFGSQIAALIETKKRTADEDYPWQDLLMMGRQFDASDPRDRFYAMLGLLKERLKAQNQSINLPAVDYTNSNEAVALEFGRLYLSVTGNLQLLSMVEDATHRITENLPSWVPDHTVRLLPVPLELNGVPNTHSDPSLSKAPTPTLDPTGRVLSVNGHEIDTITSTAPPFHHIWESHDWLSLLNLLKSLSTIQTTSTSFDEAFWRTLTTSPEIPTSKQSEHTTLSLSFSFGDWMIQNLLSIRKASIDKSSWSANLSDMLTLSSTEMDDLASGTTSFPEQYQQPGDGHPSEEALLTIFNNRPTTQMYRKLKEKMDSSFERREELETLFHATRTAMTELWKANPKGAFPDPERVRNTLAVLDDWNPDSPERRLVEERIESFKAVLGTKLHSRRVFLTRSGRIGVGPQSLREGDRVWVLEGLQVPAVLRGGDDERFGFVGQAFVCGVEYGAGRGKKDGGGYEYREIQLV